MVWGLRMPSTFGMFSPSGELVGRDQQLEKHFNEELTESERQTFHNRFVSYRRSVSDKFTKNLGPLLPHEQPTELRTDRRFKVIAALIELPNRLLAVDQDLKELIEELEPDVHQFWKIRITNKSGQEYERNFYGMIVRQFLDAFLEQGSSVDAWRMDSGWPWIQKEKYGEIRISEEVVSDAHLWRDSRLYGLDIYVSDQLHEKICERGLKVPKQHEMKN